MPGVGERRVPGRSRRVELRVGEARAQFEMLEDTAPRTAGAFWESLPISGQMTHARWAGAACWLKTERTPIADVHDVEMPATTIYRGTLALRPGKAGRAELYVSYGQAESRHERGRTYVTPIARVIGDPTALFEALAETWKAGAADSELRRIEEGSQA